MQFYAMKKISKNTHNHKYNFKKCFDAEESFWSKKDSILNFISENIKSGVLNVPTSTKQFDKFEPFIIKDKIKNAHLWALIIIKSILISLKRI